MMLAFGAKSPESVRRSAMAAGLYEGVLEHASFKGRRSRASVRLFMLLIDVNEAALKARIQSRVSAAGLAAGGPVRRLAMPRVRGGFQAAAIYFCHAADERLSALVFEAPDGAGGVRTDVVPAGRDAGMVRQSWPVARRAALSEDEEVVCAFRARPPGETLMAGVDLSEGKDVVMAATFLARRSELTRLTLIRAWLTHPSMALGLAAARLRSLKVWLTLPIVRAAAPAAERLAA